MCVNSYEKEQELTRGIELWNKDSTLLCVLLHVKRWKSLYANLTRDTLFMWSIYIMLPPCNIYLHCVIQIQRAFILQDHGNGKETEWHLGIKLRLDWRRKLQQSWISRHFAIYGAFKYHIWISVYRVEFPTHSVTKCFVNLALHFTAPTPSRMVIIVPSIVSASIVQSKILWQVTAC